MSNRVLFFCGASVGLFVGLLVGLSVSPVVATVVSAVVGIVTAFCTATLGGGLTEAIKRSPDVRGSPSNDAHIYLAGFSVAGVIAVLGGIYLRTHNVLGPTPHDIVEEWKAAGLSAEDARKIAVQAYGREASATHASVLIASSTDDCDEIEGNIARQEWSYAESFFQRAGGKWKARFDEIKAMPDDQRHSAMAEFAQHECGKASP